MDGHRFDAFVKALAAPARTRRSVLKLGGGAFAALWTGFFGARPEAALGLDAPPKHIDIIAALIQTTDPSLGPDWRIDLAEWSNDPQALTFLPAGLVKIIQDQKVSGSGALLALALPGPDGKPKQLVESFLFDFADSQTAQTIFGDYTSAPVAGVTPLDAKSLLGDSTGAFIAKIAKPDDPMFPSTLPGAHAIETIYHEGSVFGGGIFSGDDSAFAVRVSMPLYKRLQTGSVPGSGLANQLAFVDFGTGSPVSVWYSTIGGVSQRTLSATDDLFANQKAQEGGAIDFARTTQFVPSTEQTTFFRVHTWAGRQKSKKNAQAWVNGTLDRLTAQAPTAQFTAINEAQGLGDVSAGFLYTISDQTGVAVGVDLYVSQGPNVFAVGFSADSTSMTPGMTSLFGDARPLGKGAQALIGAQLAKLSQPNFGPRPVPLADVFGDSPLQPATVGQTAGGTAKTTFTACTAPTPPCGKRAVQDQTTPYQVWCQPAAKCTDAKCTCNLFRTKKKSTTAEWYGKQNDKKEYDPDNYTYSCSCGTVQES